MAKKKKKLKIKVGEWCFCEFKLQEIKQVTGEKITTVSDGHVTMGGDSTMLCFPLDADIKRISDSVSYWDKEIRKFAVIGLNHPDIKRHLVALWVTMCENKDNAAEIKHLYKNLERFGNRVVADIAAVRKLSVEGVILFRVDSN